MYLSSARLPNISSILSMPLNQAMRQALAHTMVPRSHPNPPAPLRLAQRLHHEKHRQQPSDQVAHQRHGSRRHQHRLAQAIILIAMAPEARMTILHPRNLRAHAKTVFPTARSHSLISMALIAQNARVWAKHLPKFPLPLEAKLPPAMAITVVVPALSTNAFPATKAIAHSIC